MDIHSKYLSMKKHAANLDSADRLLMVLAAHLRSKGLNQKQISEQILSNPERLSQSMVSRLLRKAVDVGVLGNAPNFLGTDDELQLARAKYLANSEIGEKLRKL